MNESKKPFLDEIEALAHKLEQEGQEIIVFEKHRWIEARSLIETRLREQGREIIETRKANKRLANILKRTERRKDDAK